MPGLSQWGALTEDIATDDLFGITNVDDPTQSAVNGSSAKATFGQLLSSIAKRLQNVSGTSGAIALDCGEYHTFVITITAATTLSFTDLAVGQTIVVVLTNAGTDITWPTEVDWPGGDEPEFSDPGTDRVVLQKLSASVIHGSLAGQEYA